MPFNRSASIRLLAGFLSLILAGCVDGSKDPQPCTTCPDPAAHQSPAAVLRELQRAYKERAPASYTNLLAGDFHFVFDPGSRPDSFPDSWNTEQDSAATTRIFNAAAVKDLRISLSYDSVATPVNQLGREAWRRILVTDTFLEVDVLPPGELEVMTMRVDGDEQEFYFRKGRTPADTLASSPTSQEWYLVEWHDLAQHGAPAQLHPEDATLPVLAVTWTMIKTQYGG